MKANEAPEKIYIHVRANKELGTTWHGKKITNSDIEFIRTDAFIEKACDYLMEYEFNDSPTIADRRKRVEEFRKYMKGE